MTFQTEWKNVWIWRDILATWKDISWFVYCVSDAIIYFNNSTLAELLMVALAIDAIAYLNLLV